MNKKIENIDCFIEINNSSVEILNKVKSLNFHETFDKEGKTTYNLEVLPSEIIPRINFKVNENVQFDLNLNISIKENAKLEFLDESDASNVKKFNIPNLDYSGSFEFDQDTGLIKMIKLNIDYNQNVSIIVRSIEALGNYKKPDFDLNRFEIIDLRG